MRFAGKFLCAASNIWNNSPLTSGIRSFLMSLQSTGAGGNEL
jgi:hypothetical protein